MTQHELFEKTFSALHASPDTISEVKRTMQNEKKTRRILGRGAVIAIAAESMKLNILFFIFCLQSHKSQNTAFFVYC